MTCPTYQPQIRALLKANPEIYLTGVCELIPCSVAAQESINDFKK